MIFALINNPFGYLTRAFKMAGKYLNIPDGGDNNLFLNGARTTMKLSFDNILGFNVVSVQLKVCRKTIVHFMVSKPHSSRVESY
ncbi:hypothetical protein ES703_79228 [subsurface metagenome]